jgi:integrase
MARNPKNDVAIQNIDGWIRLRWQYQGKRCSLRLGLPYDPINLAVAQQRVSQIRLDILSGHYDPSLVKYRGGEPKPQVTRISSAPLRSLTSISQRRPLFR